MYYKVILDSPVTGNMRFMDTNGKFFNVKRTQYKFLQINDVFEGSFIQTANGLKIKVDMLLTDDDDIVKFHYPIPYKVK